MPLKQLAADFPLKITQVARQHRLGSMQMPGRRPHTPTFGNRNYVAKLIEFQGGLLN